MCKSLELSAVNQSLELLPSLQWVLLSLKLMVQFLTLRNWNICILGYICWRNTRWCWRKTEVIHASSICTGGWFESSSPSSEQPWTTTVLWTLDGAVKKSLVWDSFKAFNSWHWLVIWKPEGIPGEWTSGEENWTYVGTQKSLFWEKVFFPLSFEPICCFVWCVLDLTAWFFFFFQTSVGVENRWDTAWFRRNQKYHLVSTSWVRTVMVSVQPQWEIFYLYTTL